MANCHSLFSSFDETIRLSETKEENLRTARDAIEDRVKKHFKEDLNENIPNFRQQGSFDLRTIVTPIDGEFDIDYGVYLNNLPDNIEEWETPQEVHDWIFAAVEKHTTDHEPEDKSKCVRVRYKSEYHVDLPIYGTYEDETYLADTDNGWVKSDPRAFRDWLLDKLDTNGEGMRRCIRYIKAWSDFQSEVLDLPPGFVLTILVAENFSKDERDDRAFAATISNIKSFLNDNEEITNPADEDEDLRERIGELVYQNLVNKIDDLNTSATEALRSESSEGACEIWADKFGDRFPNCNGLDEVGDEEALKTSSPAILDDDHRSA